METLWTHYGFISKMVPAGYRHGVHHAGRIVMAFAIAQANIEIASDNSSFFQFD